jgi:hypothetical protein
MAEVNVLFWQPKACFDTWFNKVVAALTLGDYCHAEVDFIMTKVEWMEVLGSFATPGRARERSLTVQKRMTEILHAVGDDTKIHLVFYTIWGGELDVRMLTANDSFVFNRLPDPKVTKSTPLGFDKEQARAALGFCFNELHKKYDAQKALTCFIPRFEGVCPRDFSQLPSRYFCSEFIMYLMQAVDPEYRHYYPETITPNELSKILSRGS